MHEAQPYGSISKQNYFRRGAVRRPLAPLAFSRANQDNWSGVERVGAEKFSKMSKKHFLISLGAVLLWIIFIFCRSLQPADAATLESKWVLALLQRFVPFTLTQHFVRKLAHFTEFAVLGMLAGILFGGRCRSLWSGLLFAVMTGIVTALCDETIQLFVAGRSGQITDVWLDVSGAFTGTVLTLAVRIVWHRRN